MKAYSFTSRAMPFDSVSDFTHLGMLVEAPMVLLVRAQIDSWKTVARNAKVEVIT